MKLNPDFSIERYGLKVSLVTVDDAAFILSLRADQDRTKYMLTLNSDIEQQQKWIQDYKQRELEGTDYYFIYRDLDGNPIGVNRISKIDYDKHTCKACNWIKRKGPEGEAIGMFVIHKEIIFDFLNLNSFYVDIHKDNERVLKYYSKLNLVKIKEEDNFCHFTIDKEAWQQAYNRYLEMLNH